ncbi:MAG TPA: hypothetical protein VEF07_04400 [Candidatus Binataceae bacterium]|nr:hypothetical protein [Candidatus Binataceae bacterium]
MTRLANAAVGHGRNLMVALALALGLSALGTPLALADEANHRTVSVTINKGETYTIEGVSKNVSSPGIKVTKNPNALVVRTDAPGKIILVGADAGTWNLEVTLASGEKVTYAVNVKSEAPPQGSLVPGTAPTVMP